MTRFTCLVGILTVLSPLTLAGCRADGLPAAPAAPVAVAEATLQGPVAPSPGAPSTSPVLPKRPIDPHQGVLEVRFDPRVVAAILEARRRRATGG